MGTLLQKFSILSAPKDSYKFSKQIEFVVVVVVKQFDVSIFWTINQHFCMGWARLCIFLYTPFLIFGGFCSWKLCYLHDPVEHFLQCFNIIFKKSYSYAWSLRYLKYTPLTECWYPAKKLHGLYSQLTQLGIRRQNISPSRPGDENNCEKWCNTTGFQYYKILWTGKKHNASLAHVDHYLWWAFPKALHMV